MNILIVLILFVCLVCDYGMKQEIKYDQRDKKRWWIVAWILTSLLLVAIIGLCLLNLINNPNDIIVFIVFEMLFSLPIIILVAWLQYLNCVLYLKRLREYGYELPENKNIYGGRLERLPRYSNVPDMERHDNKESIVLAIVSWIVTLGVGVGAVIFAITYAYMPDVVQICMFAYGFIGLTWLGAGIYFWHQRLYSKYRDDVEVDAKRKLRVHLVPGVAAILFMLFVTIVGFVIMDQFALVCRNARTQAKVEETYNQCF